MTEQELKTTTLLIPFNKNIHKAELGHDTVILLVPPDLVGVQPDLDMKLLQISVQQAQRMNEGIRMATWWITQDPNVVKERGEGDRCPTCTAAVDQTLAHMKDKPEAVVGVGLLSWCEQ